MRTSGLGAGAPSLLSGLIFDGDGKRMAPTHVNKRGRRYRYYISATLLNRGPSAPNAMRVPAGEVEGLVLDRLRQLLASRKDIADALAPFSLKARELDGALRRAIELSQRWLTLPPGDMRALARQVISRINLSPDGIEVAIGAAQLAGALGATVRTEDATEAPIHLAIAAELRRAGQGKRLVIGEQCDGASNSSLVHVLREAFSAREALLDPSNESLNAITSRITKSKGRLTALMRVSYLAPDIIEDMLAGRQPPELSPKRLSRLDEAALVPALRLKSLSRRASLVVATNRPPRKSAPETSR